MILVEFEFLNGEAHPNYAQLAIAVINNSPVDVGMQSMIIDWSYAEQLGVMLNYRNLLMDWIKWTNNYAWGGIAEGARPE